jgi:hypothetical protein
MITTDFNNLKPQQILKILKQIPQIHFSHIKTAEDYIKNLMFNEALKYLRYIVHFYELTNFYNVAGSANTPGENALYTINTARDLIGLVKSNKYYFNYFLKNSSRHGTYQHNSSEVAYYLDGDLIHISNLRYL